MRKWTYYRATPERDREPNVFAGPLALEAGDRLVHYLRADGVDYFGVFAESAMKAKWLAAQPQAVGLTEILAADIPQPNWHSHRCAQREEGWKEIGLTAVAHHRVVSAGEVVGEAQLICDDAEMVVAVVVGEANDGPLPADTPSLDLLQGAGIETIAQARSTDLTAISGIGEKTATKILDHIPVMSAVLHVAGPDRAGLPGTAAKLAEIPGAAVTPHTFDR